MGCGTPAGGSSSLQVRLSRDRVNFEDVSTCDPTTPTCMIYQQSSVIYASQLQGKWTRFSLDLGSSPGDQVRILLQQQEKMSFAVDNIYIGARCPTLCSGHGKCGLGGICTCDQGYRGSFCELPPALPTFSLVSFEAGLPADWVGTGGQLVSSCAVNGQGYYFSGEGLRSMTTTDLDVRYASELTFKYRVCAGSTSTRFVAAYSTNGGFTWERLATYFTASRLSRVETISLPQAARTASTRFQFFQPRMNFGAWTLDDISVGGACLQQTCSGDLICRDKPEDAFECVCPRGQKPGETLGACVPDPCAEVVCTVVDDCQDPGVCNPATGTCSSIPLNGTECDDGQASTANDMCIQGVCQGIDRCENVICPEVGVCRLPSVCNSLSGTCDERVALDLTPCDDGNDETFGDRCVTGVCAGEDSVCVSQGIQCPPPGQCEESVVCIPSNGTCLATPIPDGHECDTGDIETHGTCEQGMCASRIV